MKLKSTLVFSVLLLAATVCVYAQETNKKDVKPTDKRTNVRYTSVKKPAQTQEIKNTAPVQQQTTTRRRSGLATAAVSSAPSGGGISGKTSSAGGGGASAAGYTEGDSGNGQGEVQRDPASVRKGSSLRDPNRVVSSRDAQKRQPSTTRTANTSSGSSSSSGSSASSGGSSRSGSSSASSGGSSGSSSSSGRSSTGSSRTRSSAN